MFRHHKRSNSKKTTKTSGHHSSGGGSGSGASGDSATIPTDPQATSSTRTRRAAPAGHSAHRRGIVFTDSTGAVPSEVEDLSRLSTPSNTASQEVGFVLEVNSPVNVDFAGSAHSGDSTRGYAPDDERAEREAYVGRGRAEQARIEMETARRRAETEEPYNTRFLMVPASEQPDDQWRGPGSQSSSECVSEYSDEEGSQRAQTQQAYSQQYQQQYNQQYNQQYPQHQQHAEQSQHSRHDRHRRGGQTRREEGHAVGDTASVRSDATTDFELSDAEDQGHQSYQSDQFDLQHLAHSMQQSTIGDHNSHATQAEWQYAESASYPEASDYQPGPALPAILEEYQEDDDETAFQNEVLGGPRAATMRERIL